MFLAAGTTSAAGHVSFGWALRGVEQSLCLWVGEETVREQMGPSTGCDQDGPSCGDIGVWRDLVTLLSLTKPQEGFGEVCREGGTARGWVVTVDCVSDEELSEWFIWGVE